MNRYTQNLNAVIQPSKYGEWVRTADVNTILNNVIRNHIKDNKVYELTILKWEVVAGVFAGLCIVLVGALI